MKRALALAALLLGTQLTACATTAVVTVVGPWTGAEARHFRDVLATFEDGSGVDIDYHGTRSLTSVLASDVQNGNPPDIAILPSPNQLVNYQRQGSLFDLRELGNTLRDTYSPQWLELAGGGAGSDRPYAVVVKAALKSLVWYDPEHAEGNPPSTWDEMVDLTARHAETGRAPWCLGMGAMATSGFPGTDWIEDILLRRFGPQVYQEWAAGELSWTDPRMRETWTEWGRLVLQDGAVRGDVPGALLTDFDDAGDAMFAAGSGCFLEHQSSSAVSDYRAAGGHPGYFPTPGPTAGPPRAWEVSADLAALFRDTDDGRRLLRYLASDQAQRQWPAAEPGAAFSVNKAVARDVPTDQVGRHIAGVLTGPTTLCFDASDLMPDELATAFYRATLGYLAEPNTLDELLRQLEEIRLGMETADWSSLACGRARH